MPTRTACPLAVGGLCLARVPQVLSRTRAGRRTLTTRLVINSAGRRNAQSFDNGSLPVVWERRERRGLARSRGPVRRMALAVERRAGRQRCLGGLDRSRACRRRLRSGDWYQGAVQCSSFDCGRESLRDARGWRSVLQLLRPDPAGSRKGSRVVRGSCYPDGLRASVPALGRPKSATAAADGFRANSGSRTGRGLGGTRAGH